MAARPLLRLFFGCKIEESENSNKKSCLPSVRRILMCAFTCTRGEKVYIRKADQQGKIIQQVTSVQETTNFKMAARPSKMTKIEGKLWTSEDRFFMEKVFHLNKSTTKYLIVGNEPNSYEPAARICDRVTGTYITVKKENFPDFMHIIGAILTHQYTLDNGILRGSGDISGVKFRHVTPGIWKLCQVDLPHASINIHESSLGTLVRISRLIVTRLLSNVESEICMEVIENVTKNTFGMDQNEIIEELYSEITKYSPTCYEHQILTDLITNVESYARLGKFGEGFYLRSSNKKY